MLPAHERESAADKRMQIRAYSKRSAVSFVRAHVMEKFDQAVLSTASQYMILRTTGGVVGFLRVVGDMPVREYSTMEYQRTSKTHVIRTRLVGFETVLWVHPAKKAGKWYRGPRSSRTVHDQVARRGGKEELGAPRSPDAWRTKPIGRWGE